MFTPTLAFVLYLVFAAASASRLLHEETGGGRRDLGTDSIASFLSTNEETNLKNAYNSMFPSAKPQYSYDEFKKAWKKVFSSDNCDNPDQEDDCDYTKWGSNTDETHTQSFDDKRRYNFYRMVAFFWAHMAQESGDGQYVKEADCSTSTTADVCCSYNEQQSDCDAGDHKKYFGRGALQISHDENYKKFGQWMQDKGYSDATTWNDCPSTGSFVGCANKLEQKEYALLSGMWYFKASAMHLCGGSEEESFLNCFKRTIYKINGQQECVATYGSNSHGYHNLGWGKCTQSGAEITDRFIWKGWMNTPYPDYGYGKACRDACSLDSRCTGYNFSNQQNCIHWTASPIDDPMTAFYGWGHSFCWKKMPLRNEAAARFEHLKDATSHLCGFCDSYSQLDQNFCNFCNTVKQTTLNEAAFSCDFCDPFKNSLEPHQESLCYDDSAQDGWKSY